MCLSTKPCPLIFFQCYIISDILPLLVYAFANETEWIDWVKEGIPALPHFQNKMLQEKLPHYVTKTPLNSQAGHANQYLHSLPDP